MVNTIWRLGENHSSAKRMLNQDSNFSGRRQNFISNFKVELQIGFRFEIVQNNRQLIWSRNNLLCTLCSGRRLYEMKNYTTESADYVLVNNLERTHNQAVGLGTGTGMQRKRPAIHSVSWSCLFLIPIHLRNHIKCVARRVALEKT